MARRSQKPERAGRAPDEAPGGAEDGARTSAGFAMDPLAYADSDVVLERPEVDAVGSPEIELLLAAPQSAAIPLRGAIDSIGADGRLEGWAWSPAEPGVRRHIRLSADGVVIAETVADVPRGDLAAAGIGDGAHSFLIALPPGTIRPGAETILAIHDVSTGLQLGTDVPVTGPAIEADPMSESRSSAAPDAEPTATALLVHGHVDEVTNDGWVSGWCWYPEHPDRRADVEILVDEVLVARIRAADFRPDLAQASIGDGQHGFSYALPWELLAAKGSMTVAVRDAATGIALANPVTLRIGALAQTEDRITELEREVQRLRAEVSAYSREAIGNEEQHAARELFRRVGAFFADLADSSSPHEFAGAGLRGAVASFTEAHPPLTLQTPKVAEATILIGASAPASVVYRCIAALKATGADRRADIIVIDDGGFGGESALLPSTIGNLRYHRIAAGLAALAGIEDAARNARASIVICISPHVTVEPGCIDAMLATFADAPDIAVVGANIVRPDGMLASSGVRLADGLSPVPIGRAEPANVPEYNFLRAVDAVDARAFALNRDAIDAGGGWPPLLYATPGVAMANICLATRDSGRSVVCQPHAVATLVASAPADTGPDEIDVQRLRLQWQGRAPRSSGFVGHALVIDGQLPRPDRDSGSVLTYEIMQVLRSLGWRVTFAPTNGVFDDAGAASMLERQGIELARPPRYRSVTSFLQERGADIGIVHVFRHTNAGLLMERIREFAPAAKVIFAPADLHHLREEREAALTGRAFDQTTRERELAIVASADATIVHSDHERDLLGRHAAPERLHLLRWISRPLANVPPFAARSGLCFVGGFQHLPNVDAVVWFVESVMPLVRLGAPDIMFHVIGPDAPPAIMNLASRSVIVRGWIADLQPLFATMRLSVAPLRFGSGFKGKVATSLAQGVPVVGTSIAIEGTGLADGDGVRIADDADAFARTILDLYEDPALWAAQSARGLDRCRALYSVEEAREVWRNLLGGFGLPYVGGGTVDP